MTVADGCSHTLYLLPKYVVEAVNNMRGTLSDKFYTSDQHDNITPLCAISAPRASA